MTDHKQAHADLLARLGYKPLNRAWAKLEILLGLTAAGAGLLLGDWTVSHAEPELVPRAIFAALTLFTFGGYLTLAGHRSHLYQSNNALTAFVVSEIHKLRDKGALE
jgi:hypothetical protein